MLDIDPVGAYSLAYDAARKALAAVLVNQGLRATSRGGHVAVYETVKAQLDPPLGSILRPFSRMRVRRNESEYRSAEAPPITAEEVTEDLPKAQAIIELAEKAMPHMGRY
ncbi:HEPN domain-containing protein [Kitasatospora hibisci]|uniref:HEPN domain-containing protein n=1 Tax=Kitasatospora hibisci TaxID=3369522 RepID=UPI0037546EF4